MPGMEIPKGLESQEVNTQASLPRSYCKQFYIQTNLKTSATELGYAQIHIKTQRLYCPWGKWGRRFSFPPFPHTIYLRKLLSTFSSLQNIYKYFFSSDRSFIILRTQECLSQNLGTSSLKYKHQRRQLLVFLERRSLTSAGGHLQGSRPPLPQSIEKFIFPLHKGS